MWGRAGRHRSLGLECCEQSIIKSGVRFYFSKLPDLIITLKELMTIMPLFFLFNIHNRILIIAFTGSSVWLSVPDN